MTEKSWIVRAFEQLSGRKIFRTVAAYAVGAWLLVEVATTVLPLFGAGDGVLRIIVIALIAGFPVAMVLAWVFDISRAGITRTREVGPTTSRSRRIDFAIITALAVAVGLLLFERTKAPSVPTTPDAAAAPAAAEETPPSIAVLPFENFSNDPANEMFGNGLAEELLNKLAKIGELRVAARTSAFRFKDTNKDVREIGKLLNVATVLAGSVNAAGDTIRISAQLIDVRTGFHIWSERYDRQMTDVFAIQDDIATAVANNLKIQLLGEDEADPPAEPTKNLDAYRLYLRGREEWHKRTSASLARAIELFEQAIDLDPAFALAWSGLADSYNFSANYGNMPRAEALAKSSRAATRALELGPDLAEAHASMGLVLQDDFRFVDAAQSFSRAIELRPNFAAAHMWLGGMLMWIDGDAAVASRRRAVELDPLSPIANHLLGATLANNGNIEEARAQFLGVIDFAPDYPLVYFDLAELSRSQFDYVSTFDYLMQAKELDPGRALTLVSIAFAFMELGDTARARQWIERALAIGPDQQAVKHAQLSLMIIAGDWDGVEQFAAANFADEASIVDAEAYRSAVAYGRGEYDKSAAISDGVFESINRRQTEEIAKYPVQEQTQFALIYLASSLKRSGNETKGTDIARLLLEYVAARRADGSINSDNQSVEIAAHIVAGERQAGLDRMAELAEAGYTNYLRFERDGLYSPLRNELEFQVSINSIRENAKIQLRKIDDLEV